MQVPDMRDGDMPRKKGTRPFVNRPPQGLPAGAPHDAALVEFGSKLQDLMNKKGWTQSDLARAAAKFMPDKKFNRDNVSQYVRGLSFPLPMRLNAIAKALGVPVEDLRPAGLPGAGSKNPPLELRAIGDGMAWLHVNQAIPMDVAMQIVSILGKRNGTDQGK